MRRALIAAALLLVATAAVAVAAGISVKPSVGTVGKSFTISFTAPTTQAAGYYHVKATAVNSHGGSCVPSLSFTNPKPVSAGLKVDFTFKTSAAQELCVGTWHVTVTDPTGLPLVGGGTFTLGEVSTPKARHHKSTPTVTATTTTSATRTTTARKPSKTKTSKTRTVTVTTTATTTKTVTKTVTQSTHNSQTTQTATTETATSAPGTTPTAGTIQVTPTSGGVGTSFTVSFRTPSAVSANELQVQARAKKARAGSCVGKLDFSNPKAEGANVNISESFRVTAAEELCKGSWAVSVRNTAQSKTVLSGGSFTIK